MKINAAGIPWYKDDAHYREIKGMVTDPQVFFDTFKEWLTTAEATESRVKKEGVPVVRVPLTLPDFANWCKEKNQPMDASARSGYANEQAYQSLVAKQAS